MYKRSVTSPAVRGQIVFMGILSLVLAILIPFMSVEVGKSGIHVILMLTGGGLFLLGVAYWQSRHAVIVDKNGVRADIGRHKGDIPWDNVGEIGIIRTLGGERIVYIASQKATPYTGGAALAFSKPSDEVIKVGYNKELLEAIEQHYSGPIFGKKEAKVN